LNSRWRTVSSKPTPVSLTMKLSPRRPLDAQRHLAEGGELHGVGQQVVEDLADASGVAQIAARDARLDRPVEVQALGLGRGAVQLGHAADQGGQVERREGQLELAGLDLGDVEDVAEHLLQQAARRGDQGGQLAAALGVGLLGQAVADGDDPVQRRAQLVGHVGQEHRLGLVGALQLGGALGDPLLQRAQQLDIAVALAAQGAGQGADLVGARLDRLGLDDGAGAVGVGQHPQRPLDGQAHHPIEQRHLDDHAQHAEQQHPRGRLDRRHTRSSDGKLIRKYQSGSLSRP
jgi:hypothetical protein